MRSSAVRGLRGAVGALIVCACGTPAPDDGAVRGAAAVDCTQLTEQGLLLDDLTRRGLLEQLGVPDTTEVGVLRLADGGADSVFIVHYAGLSVSMHKAAGGTEVVDEVRVTDNRYLRFPEIGIGTAAFDVRTAVQGGAPLVTDDALVFMCHSHPANDNPVALHLLNGAVSAITFTYYMD